MRVAIRRYTRRIGRCDAAEALKAAGRPYRVAVVSSSIAVIHAAVLAGLGVGAFTSYAMPEGLIPLGEDLPDLGTLEYVIDRKPALPKAAEALEQVLAEAAKTG